MSNHVNPRERRLHTVRCQCGRTHRLTEGTPYVCHGYWHTPLDLL